MLGEIWKIGDWSVFPAKNTLRRDGSEVKVPPRLMDALIFFARHPDHVISRTELVAHLWNRSVTSDIAAEASEAAVAGQRKSGKKRSKFIDFARSFLLDEVELGFKKYPY